LNELDRFDAQQARIVELFFGGLSIDETSRVLQISPATVKVETGRRHVPGSLGKWAGSRNGLRDVEIYSRRYSMIPKHWEEIKEKLDAALDLEPCERPAYLDKIASGNPELRHELESLLAAHERAGVNFLRPSSFSHLTLKTGTKLGDHEVLTLLGSGGMGEVYRARDLRLRRDVAIKVLPALVSSDPERLRRFEQEAQAAAALNHPNILAVYQMGLTKEFPI
jgi:hypothetical protein